MERADSPLAQHRRNVLQRGFRDDPAQTEALKRLDAIHRRLAEQDGRRLSKVIRLKRQPPAKGLYLWGGVGRGKTYLMDLFCECLPGTAKLRLHFHRFMLRVHGELARLKGAANPLDKVADGMRAEASVICFDEFFVSDIGDAMILGELLNALFERRVTLVATSNVAPGRLYENGLQRRRFLPAIERIEAHMDVLRIAAGEDYRLRALGDAGTYQWPLSPLAQARLAECFQAFSPAATATGDAGEPATGLHAPAADGVAAMPGAARDGAALEVNGRRIQTRRRGPGVAWFDFAELCEGPRSAHDYVELAKEFHAVVLSGVPVFDGRDDGAARRFVSLIDEFYDRNVKLALSAAAAPEALYRGERLAQEFQRTQSRLNEMRSRAYLGRPHKP